MQNKKPKVLSISHYGSLYGANRSLLSLVIALKDKIDWWIICREKGNFTDELERHHIPYTILPFTLDTHGKPRRFQLFHSYKRFIFNILVALYVTLLIYKRGIRVIHSNSSVIFIGALIALFSGRPHVWHLREFVYEDYNLKYNFGKESFKFWATRARTIICISKSILQKRVLDMKINTHSPIVYNGLVDKSINAQIKESLNSPVLIGIVGVIDPAKGQLTAVKAINILKKKGKNVKLLIIGDTGNQKYFDSVTALIKEYGIKECVELTGFNKDISSIFQSLDISLMCSANEAFGRVTIESMMYGIPVVALGSAGTMEIIEHRHTGLLYSGDEYELSNKIEDLIMDKDLYNRVANNALRHVNTNFTVQTYAEHFFYQLDLALQ